MAWLLLGKRMLAVDGEMLMMFNSYEELLRTLDAGKGARWISPLIKLILLSALLLLWLR